LNDIARDLHDDVGQMLTFSIIQLNNLKPSEPQKLATQIAEVKESVQNTLQSVRGISKTLSNDYISSFGIKESLSRLFERLRKQNLVECIYEYPADLQFVTRSHELFIFRIIQELVSNTLKHGEASRLRLTFSEEQNMMTITYHDNGKGFILDAQQLTQLRNSQGFSNIFKRAELMKGKVMVQSAPGDGFRFQMNFPNE
jgi:signal transduction histidine kinase